MKSRARALPALLLLAFAAAAPATAAPRRYAVVIGQNSGAPDEQTLRYAVADAERMRRALIDVGGFAVEDVQLLTGVESADVTRTLISLNARMRREANGALLFVYYSGHGDAEALHLAGTRLELNELKSLVEGSAAQARVLVVDACRAGGMTRAKGGHAVPAFEVSLDDTLLAEGTAILTSSAASEDAQESDVLGASFFSHFPRLRDDWRGGLQSGRRGHAR